MKTLDIIMIFVLPAMMGVVGTISIIYFLKKYSPKDNERNTTLLMNIATDDTLGILLLGYFFSWCNAIIGWGIIIIATIGIPLGIIKPI